MASHEKWVVGYRAAEPDSRMGEGQRTSMKVNGPMQSTFAPAYGWWHHEKDRRLKTGKVSSSRRLVAQARSKAARDEESDGSGRSSDYAEGQHNPGGAKDPWGGGVSYKARIVPTCPSSTRANGSQRSRSRGDTKDESNLLATPAGQDASDAIVRTLRLEAVLGKTRRTEFQRGTMKRSHGTC
jgi:hypothetical protein